MKECCETCRRHYKLEKWDYSRKGCDHTDMEGYVCSLFMDNGVMCWTIGLDAKSGMCEGYEPKEG